MVRYNVEIMHYYFSLKLLEASTIYDLFMNSTITKNKFAKTALI
jgi:hypothetical protein